LENNKRMKATIDENGVLTVRSETPLETFALKLWQEAYDHDKGALMVIADHREEAKLING
jgi:hypothetical protein